MPRPLRSPLTRLLPTVALALCMVVLTGCASTAFKREWNTAARPGTEYDSLEGPWTGHWKSNASGHSGRLRCLVRQVPGEENTYDFHYWATFAKMLSAQYRVRYTVSEKNGVYHLSGEQDLGKFGGVYSHRGEATSEKFHSTYRAKSDQGFFEMERP